MLSRPTRMVMIAVLLLAAVLSACVAREDVGDAGGSAVALRLAARSGENEFARATEIRSFQFPEDHGPHFDYQTEWWYYTGNLTSDDGQRFGYQFTIFRRALAPGAPPGGGSLSTNQVYFAHIALTDVAEGEHFFEERFSRGAADLAGAQAAPFEAWVEDWRVEAKGPGAEKVQITAATAEFELSLLLEAEKPIVMHGESGLSAKSDEPGNASYYLSFTRMQAGGTLVVGDKTFSVSGPSWFDHEWSTSVLDEGTVGWDWFGLQLDDGRELMLYYIRQADGSIGPISGGTYIAADGEARSLTSSEIQITAVSTWYSDESGAEYPSGWQISLPSLDMNLTIEPWIDAQEMRVSFTYWEGAVRITGEEGGTALSGSGYVELTGYLESMEGVLS
ncbi:MAG: lipocalin-like domain-containing protein [Anaerolineales bacterium]|nr:lipocalin-like domain-containing protein [Anaerolineales bacterium]